MGRFLEIIAHFSLGIWQSFQDIKRYMGYLGPPFLVERKISGSTFKMSRLSGKSQTIGFLSNTGIDTLENHKDIKPVFNVGPSSLKMARHL